MRARFIQHAPFEGLGSARAWFGAAGYDVSNTQLFESSAFPKPEDIDFLIVMGGPMSIHDEDVHPWLGCENQAFQVGRSVLGLQFHL